MLEIGQTAPDFTTIDHLGNEITLSKLKGKKVILYFYPKDDTPGCTKEACNLRDHLEKLQSMGFVLLGVSADTLESHKKFANKHHLNFSLLLDEDKKIIHQYGAWGKKNMYGKITEGIMRYTYIIDEEGKIQHIIKKVKTDAHSEQILSLFKK
jgi:peroxiredoxin Q/BCP